MQLQTQGLNNIIKQTHEHSLHSLHNSGVTSAINSTQAQQAIVTLLYKKHSYDRLYINFISYSNNTQAIYPMPNTNTIELTSNCID